MIDKIKAWFFYRDFRVDGTQNKAQNAGLNSEQNIAVLFDGTNEEDRKTVHRFKKKLNPDGKKNIYSLAFIDNALPLDNVDYAAYNHKNLKWYGVPFGSKVEEFMEQNNDMLIVLCKEMKPHFEFIIAHCHSRFKVGPDIKHSEKYLNLIIECNEYKDIESIANSIIKGIDKIAVK